MSTVPDLYDKDFFAWALKNAELLRQGRLSEIDVMNVAEELGHWFSLIILHLIDC